MKNFLRGNKESLSKKVSCLRLSSRAIADSLKGGSFRSLYRGQGIEFSGVREYLHGDDVRSIDWNVTARMCKPYVKMFEEDQQLQLFLVVDRSFSMLTGTNGRVKYEQAAEISAILSMAAELNESPIGAVFFDGKIHFTAEPKSGPGQTMLLLLRLDEIESVDNGSALKNALTGAVKMIRNRSMIFIISDFRVSGWEEEFKMLSQKNDVTLIKITDPGELELPEVGTVPFTDAETGARLMLPTSSSVLKSMWRDEYRKRNERLKDFALKHGSYFLSISTEEDAMNILVRHFASRERRR